MAEEAEKRGSESPRKERQRESWLRRKRLGWGGRGSIIREGMRNQGKKCKE